jgi:hypothetical protein
MSDLLERKSNRPQRWIKTCLNCHQIVGKEHTCPKSVGFIDRLITKFESDGDCYRWTGYVPADGYPRIHYPPFKRPIKASRAVWMFFNGPIPNGMFVCHTCDNPRCVRIEHMWLGTPADMIRKGRHKFGGLKHGH